jgi:hypothetical protein
MADKVYLKCSAKEKTFRNGGAILKIGIKVEELAAFVKAHKNERGYINLAISPRREVGQYGDTHSVYLDAPPPQQQQQDDDPAF